MLRPREAQQLETPGAREIQSEGGHHGTSAESTMSSWIIDPNSQPTEPGNCPFLYSWRQVCFPRWMQRRCGLRPLGTAQEGMGPLTPQIFRYSVVPPTVFTDLWPNSETQHLIGPTPAHRVSSKFFFLMLKKWMKAKEVKRAEESFQNQR